MSSKDNALSPLCFVVSIYLILFGPRKNPPSDRIINSKYNLTSQDARDSNPCHWDSNTPCNINFNSSVRKIPTVSPVADPIKEEFSVSNKVSYDSCYAAHTEEFFPSSFKPEILNRECSKYNTEYQETIHCVPGFVEAQKYYSFIVRNRPGSKIGSRTCVIKKTCCRVSKE